MRILTDLELKWLKLVCECSNIASRIDVSKYKRTVIDHDVHVSANCCSSCDKALSAVSTLEMLRLIKRQNALNCCIWISTESGKKELELQILARYTLKVFGNVSAAT